MSDEQGNDPAIFADENLTPEQIKERDEIKTYFKQPGIGIDPDKLCARAGDKTWDFVDKAYTAKIRNKLRIIQLKHDQTVKKIVEQQGEPDADIPQLIYDRQELDISTTRDILELGLDGFKYDEIANDPKIGPIVLQTLATDVCVFLVATGPSVALRHSQMQARSVDLVKSISKPTTLTASQIKSESTTKQAATSEP